MRECLCVCDNGCSYYVIIRYGAIYAVYAVRGTHFILEPLFFFWNFWNHFFTSVVN